MLRNAFRHKTQFGVAASGAADLCLVLGGSSRLARMMQAYVGPQGGPFLWQRREPLEAPDDLQDVAQDDVGQGVGLLFDPLCYPAAQGARLRAAFAPRRIGTVLCLAGVIRGDAAALALNSALAIAALRLAQALGAGQVLLASSAAVYGAQAGRLHEDLPLVPASPYGAAKAQMEAEAVAWRDAHAPEIEICALRIGNVAGADALFGRADALFGRADAPATLPAAPPVTLDPVALDIFADGHGPWRSYIGPRGFALAMARAVAAPALPSAVNIALQGTVSMDALLEAAGWPFTSRVAGAGAIAAVELDCSRAVALGLVPPSAADAREIVAELRAYRALEGTGT